MPTTPHTPAQHHYIEAEQILASLGSLGATDGGSNLGNTRRARARSPVDDRRGVRALADDHRR